MISHRFHLMGWFPPLADGKRHSEAWGWLEGTEIAVFLPDLGKHPIQSLVRIDRDDYPLVVRCVLPFHHISAILVIDKEPYSLVVIRCYQHMGAHRHGGRYRLCSAGLHRQRGGWFRWHPVSCSASDHSAWSLSIIDFRNTLHLKPVGHSPPNLMAISCNF
jgi:hypothetical protein